MVGFTLGAALGYLLLAVAHLDPSRLLDVSTTGVRNIALPAIAQASARGIDPAFVIFTVNSVATLVLVSFLFSVRIYDPTRPGRFSAWWRRQAENDPLTGLLRRYRDWREIADPAARPIFTSLLVVPVAGATALGLMLGTIFAALWALTGPGLHSGAIALVYILPHGLLEVGAILLGAAAPVSVYLESKSVLRSDESHAVFTRVREIGGSRRIKILVVVALMGLAVAAIIETRLTGLVVDVVTNRMNP